MKIRYCSDLHLEFNPVPEFTPNSDEVLLVAGDTVLIEFIKPNRTDADARALKKKFEQFLEMVSGYKNVYFIGGNHEPYTGVIDEVEPIFREALAPYGNLTFLEDEYVELVPGTIMLAATLWTDMNKDNPLTHIAVGEGMNDFMIVRKGNKKFTTKDAYTIHQRSLMHLSHMYQYNTYDYEKNVPDGETDILVMTHHAPSIQSTTRYNDGLPSSIDSGYHSDLEGFILDRPQIKHWIHGHTHWNVDYHIGDCHVLTNHRGYGVRGNKDKCYDNFNLESFIEVEPKYADEKKERQVAAMGK